MIVDEASPHQKGIVCQECMSLTASVDNFYFSSHNEGAN
jgi:hypothetical protein